MKIRTIEPPREFKVGVRSDLTIQHTADIALDPDEQVTFETEAGAEYDVVRKAWGYYATPSMNGRLAGNGLRAVLARNTAGRLYLLLVERGRESLFDAYLAAEQQTVVCWLDSDEAVARLVRALSAES